MKELFSDLPEAIINLKEIYEKVESYDLNREVFSQNLTFLLILKVKAIQKIIKEKMII